MEFSKVVKKRRFFNKLKQDTERFLVYVFALIGMLATLNFAINTFREAGEWYFMESKTVGIVVPVRAGTAILADTKEASPVNTERGMATSPLPLDKIADYIYLMESSSGKNNAPACEKIGKVNGYGFAINKYSTWCFNNDNETREEVKKWIIKRANEGLSVPEMLCFYHLGIKTSDCDYIQAFN